MKTILVFKDGELIKQLRYKTKRDAKGQYKLFIKHGMIEPMTGTRIHGLTFELI